MREEAVIRSNLIYKNIRLDNFTFPALIGTGCDLSLIRYDTIEESENVKLSSEQVMVHGVKDSFFTTIGSFSAKIEVDGVVLLTKFHVVRECDLKYAAVIGNDVLKQVDILCRENGTVFLPKDDKNWVTHDRMSEEVALNRRKEVRGGNEFSSCKDVKDDKDVEGAKNSEDGVEVKDGENAKDVKDDKDVSAVEEDDSELFHVFNAICTFAQEEVVKPIEVELDHLSGNHAKVISELVQEYKPTCTERTPVEMKIILTDDLPVCQTARRLSQADKEVVEQQVDKWIQEGIVRPSSSEYASPIVLVSKKDGTRRLCCDYRKLNEKILRDNFPMANMDDVLERLSKAKVFISLDLKNGFFHVPIAEESMKYTAFVTHFGIFEFLVVPFGITN